MHTGSNKEKSAVQLTVSFKVLTSCFVAYQKKKEIKRIYSGEGIKGEKGERKTHILLQKIDYIGVRQYVDQLIMPVDDGDSFGTFAKLDRGFIEIPSALSGGKTVSFGVIFFFFVVCDC